MSTLLTTTTTTRQGKRFEPYTPAEASTNTTTLCPGWRTSMYTCSTCVILCDICVVMCNLMCNIQSRGDTLRLSTGGEQRSGFKGCPGGIHKGRLRCCSLLHPRYNNNDNNNRIQRRYSRFFTISSQRRELSPTRRLKWPRRNRVQIMCNTSNAYHEQVSCYVPLCTKGQLSC